MISLRFVVIACILLAIALVPTVMHSYFEATTEDGLTVKAISNKLSGFSSDTTERRAAWVEETFDTNDWIERRYTRPGSNKILLFAIRSFDLKRLYHHPEIGVLRGVDLQMEGIQELKGMAEVPAYVLKSRQGKGLAAYVLLYDGQFIENPILMQVFTSVKLLFRKRKAMTLFMVYDEHARNDSSLEQSSASEILESAIRSFHNQKSESIL
jgi:hypothetical protein